MTRSGQLLLLGFLLAAIGMILLVVGMETGPGVFSVFPFVFVNGISPLLALAGLAAFIVLLYFMIRPDLLAMQEESYLQQAGSRKQYIRIDNACSYCGGPIPEGGVYCPRCGMPSDGELNQ